MKNAERFIEIYNKVDKILRNLDNEEFESFTSKIRKSSNPLIKNFKEKLIDYAQLRNAIVHNPKIGGQFIAIPLDEVTIDFENILFKLQNPKKVIPLFQFEVIGAERNDKLDKLLAKMKEHSFSQFPVFENGRVVEIITTNTISRWLSRNIIDNHIMEENPVIESLMGDIEFAKNYKFISRDENIYTAFNMFLSHIENNKRNLDAIFITQNGKSDQNLLGLITIEDIALQINAA